MIQPLPLSVTEISGSVVSGKTPDGQTIRLPLGSIHGTPKVGHELRLIATAPGSEDAGKTEMARSILNELLGSKS